MQNEVVQPFQSADLEALFRLHARSLFLYVARRVGPAEAEDICAQAFAEAWRNRDRFDPERGSGRAWIFGIATNLVRDHKRGEMRRLRAYSRTGVDRGERAFENDVVDRIDASDRWRVVAEVFAALRPIDRDIVWLVAAGLTYAEVAEIVQVPVGTIKSGLARTRAKLAAAGVDETPTISDTGERR